MAAAQCVSILSKARKRIKLLFFDAHGAPASDITCRLWGRWGHRESKMKQLVKMSAAPATALFALAFLAMTTPAAAGLDWGSCQSMAWPTKGGVTSRFDLVIIRVLAHPPCG